MLTIENNQLKVGIDETGAQLVHLIDKDGNFDFMWNGTEWKKHAPIFFPAVGASINNEYVVNGKKYSMQLGGFAQDYPWTVVDKGDDRVSLTLTDNEDSLKLFPFAFSLMVTYRLEGNQVHVTFAIKNNSKETMPYALGFAPTFNVPIIVDGLSFNDYKLSFMPEVPELKKYVLNNDHLRKNETLTLNNSDKSNLDLKYADFMNGPIVLATPGLTKATISSEKSEHEISVGLEEFDHVELWTLAEKESKFLCLAPINGLPDKESSDLTNWMEKSDNHFIEPDEKEEFSTTITVK